MITYEQELILDAWNQFASYQDKGETKYSNMGLSTLEAIERYLRDEKLINAEGKPNW